MSGWQPQQDDPRRAGGQPPQQWQQHPPPGYRPPPWQQQGHQQSQPQQVPYQRPEARRQHQRPREMNPYAGWVAFAIAMVVIVAGVAWYVTDGRPSAATASASSGVTSLAAAQPETEAGVRAAATQFYALYSAGQWAQAYAMLTPSAQQEVSESTFVAVHQGCPSASAGLARVIKSVTMAGATAVVTETVGGALSSLGSVTDAWDYSAGRWGIALSASSLKDYSHGSATADIAAAKAAGQCAS